MEPRISLVTLGVSNLARSVAFYRDGLGLPIHAEFDGTNGVAFFTLRGTWLSLYPRDELAHDANAEVGNGFANITLAHNVASEAEVDALLARVERAGATIVKPAAKALWGGYSGYFADSDGFRWEIAHNPFLTIE